MLLKLVLLMMVWHRGAASDDLLSALAGTHGGNRVSLCMGAIQEDDGPPRCAGVLCHPQWVLTRASCLEQRSLYKVLVLRDTEGVSCEDFDNGVELWEARKLRVKFVHPEYLRSERTDLALVAVDNRWYHSLDHLANTTTVHQLLSEFAPWMDDVYTQYPMGRRVVSYAHKSSLFSTPLRMFFTAIVLPSVLFMMFFLFVIFFTGPKDEIPYKSIVYEESEKSEIGDNPSHI